MTTSTAGLEAALWYARRGWAVHPCHGPALSGCTCRTATCPSPAKHPRTRNGLHDATTDPGTITRWWRRWPDANVAVRTGAVSGMVVLDVDPDHGGLKTLADLEEIHGVLPETSTVRTGSGGRHIWFAHPGGRVANSTGRLGPGLDVRGDGGYVIVPPSRHVSGARYIWASEVALAHPPDWLTITLTAPGRRDPPPIGCSLRIPEEASAGPWARAALAGEIRRVRGASIGTRNVTLNRTAFALGQLVGAGHLCEEAVRAALLDAATQTGLTVTEARATIASGIRAGSRFPRFPRSTRAPGIAAEV